MELLQLFRGSSESRAEHLAALRPVVLMGRGHSGTRVLAWMCAHLGLQLGSSAPHVTGDPDDVKFTDRIKGIAARNLDITSPYDASARAMRKFRSAVAAYWRGLGQPMDMWGWKFPETYLIAPIVARAFPQARYLHLVRDGRDLAFKRHLTDNTERRVGRAVLAACGATTLPHHLQAASSWAYQVDRFDAFKTQLATSSVFEVRFEDLCTAPRHWAERLCEFLGVPMTDECRRYTETGIDAQKIAQYLEEYLRQCSELEQRIAPTLRRYRYMA